jgi:Ca2+-binding EF-hand superfamily protein
VEQSFIKSNFIDKLLKTTLTSSRISIDQIEYLFRTLDKDNSNDLDENEIAELVKIIGDKTTDEKMSKEVSSYITTQLFQVLDKNNNKTIELDELKKYLSIHGLVINLNIEEK